jgi:hypothetical protein
MNLRWVSADVQLSYVLLIYAAILRVVVCVWRDNNANMILLLETCD